MGRPYYDVNITAQDGLRLYYRDYAAPTAAKTPLLCLPGLTRNSVDFQRFAERYCADRRIIAVDYRGRGQSDWPNDKRTYSPQTYLSDLHHVLASANCHRVIAVGTSLGGIIAMAMGAMMPATLAGVVLNDVGPELDEAGVRRIQGYVGKSAPPENFEEAAAILAKNYGTAFPDYDHEEWLREARLLYVEDLNGSLVDDYDPAVSQSIAGGPPGEIDLWALFASLRDIPVLSFRSELSDILSLETWEKMQKMHPVMQTITVSNRGHAPTYDEAECLTALPEFFAKCDETFSRHA